MDNRGHNREQIFLFKNEPTWQCDTGSEGINGGGGVVSNKSLNTNISERSPDFPVTHTPPVDDETSEVAHHSHILTRPAT